MAHEGQADAGGQNPRRLFVYNGGFLTQRRVRRILSLSGYRISLGRPTAGDMVGVWGVSPTAHRGEAMAQRCNAPILRVEDAFLRSLHPGRAGEPPMGLLLDQTGVHFDASQPSDLERILAEHPLDDAALMARARGAVARMKDAHLSKYSATRLDAALPDPGYVLVVDQTAGDASVRASGADRARFLEMLTYARQEHPGARIILKTHPETSAGFRGGHYRDSETQAGIEIYDGDASPWQVLDGAIAVYTVSSQMGFEAILAGHRPRVFGAPFYAGWGLTDDQDPVLRRQRKLSRMQLFAAAMILYPVWYDPYHDRLCALEDVLGALEARSRAWREDCEGWIGQNIRLWKRPHFQKFFGQNKRMVFTDHVDKAPKRPVMGWANKAHGKVTRVEDGFLRSRGLGAELIPPLSLVLDDLGIYYDPNAPSRLERLIAQRAADLRPDQALRAERLVERLSRNGLSKYNLPGAPPDLPKGHRILVPGQVEDDASIQTGAGDIRRNVDLLAYVRAENPDAVIIWKPHPDVLAGLRTGSVDKPEDYCDITLTKSDMGPLLHKVDEVWTMTSLSGFEALLRGCKVTTVGAPFYAGWGLTRDLGPVPNRRLSGPRPNLNALVHATLIDYPRYFDPKTNAPCPVETVVDRLSSGDLPKPGPFNRSLRKLQGVFASQAHLWRR